MASDEGRAAASDELGGSMMPWRPFLARATVASGLLGIAMFVALRLAAASPGGPTRHELTYAGVLRNADGGVPVAARMTALTFTFSKTGAAPCVVEVPRVEVAAGGAFTAPVSLASCPNYFDGSDVTYTVAEGGTVLTDGGVPITPVPYARFADQVGVNNECPVGYLLDTSETTYIVCRRPLGGGAFDEVIRVGSSATAFWIDRYEASIWDNRDAVGIQYGVSRDDYEVGGRSFPDNGVWVTPLYAVSRRVPLSPSRYITWFQAQTACRLAGKRLPTRDEWIAAANGSPDSADVCRTSNPAGGTRNTGGSSCVSRWGAEDMVGNVWEWTDEWFGGAGSHPGDVADGGIPGDSGMPGFRARWPAGYNNDTVLGVFSYVVATNGDFVRNLPAAAVRGGDFGNSDGAGVFAMEIAEAPSAAYSSIGFRCVIPR